MKLRIELDMDSAAFADDWMPEASRILLNLADWLDIGQFPDRLLLRDINGNDVGKLEVIRD